MPEIHNYFEGWAVVELFGHGKAIGFVTTEYFGTACMFRVDTPERAEREYILDKPVYGYSDTRMSESSLPVGTKVKRPGIPAHSRLLGPGSIFAINPTSEELAKVQLERDEPRPLICLELPENYRQKALNEPADFEGDEDENEDELDDAMRATGEAS